MQITLSNIGKRYNYEWIFRKVNYEFTNTSSYVILGSNGSGKSTLLQVIAGSLISSEGEIKYKTNSREARIPVENIFQYLSFVSPYLELFEEFTLRESIEFQTKFKPFKGLTTEEIIAITQLEKTKDKQLKHYSSGMKQRVKLALAILADTPLLLLDEPTSNLDKKAIDWYQNLITCYTQKRLVIVCSNQLEQEYFFCEKQVHIEEYK